ncbi:MAG: DNA-processing protein DprA, partial [candidate division Zixibacteria bacterium]|nr:DNA-processing protein DprA [candidate division Zixibacteria bacterium]
MISLPFEELKALIVLNRLGRSRSVRTRIREGARPSEVLNGLPRDGKEVPPGWDPEKEIESCLKKEIRLLTLFDPAYPRLLKEISDPPLLLYMAGAFDDSDAAAVAVVGSRNPSFYGLEQTRIFAGALARMGITVVSGLARGIDGAAHEAALGVSSGRTLAVVGCGIDIPYPREHRKLFEAIRERGAVVSEYPLGTPPLACNFPERNRIIAGLSLGVLVVEAHIRSGSLITAHEAADEGREVFALPGPVTQLTSKGTHRLIKDGAALVEDPME